MSDNIQKNIVEFIFNDVVGRNLSHYCEQLNHCSDTSEMLSDWKNMTEIYRGLNDAQRKSFEVFLGNVIVESVAGVLGVIDGAIPSDVYDGEVYLCGNDRRILSGDLQDEFLSYVQDLES